MTLNVRHDPSSGMQHLSERGEGRRIAEASVRLTKLHRDATIGEMLRLMPPVRPLRKKPRPSEGL
jgi:hypothetical protein